MSEEFAAAVRQGSDISFIDLSGEINSFAERGLNDAYASAEDSGPSTIVLNFSDVTYINSTGIALIVGLLARSRGANRAIAVFGLDDHYQEIFQITRLSDFMSIYPDEETVLANVISQA